MVTTTQYLYAGNPETAFISYSRNLIFGFRGLQYLFLKSKQKMNRSTGVVVRMAAKWLIQSSCAMLLK